MSAPTPRPDERSTTPRTLAQLWTRGATDGPLELNRRESATCAACGMKPREQRSTTPSGREVVAYIPVDHVCRGRK